MPIVTVVLGLIQVYLSDESFLQMGLICELGFFKGRGFADFPLRKAPQKAALMKYVRYDPVFPRPKQKRFYCACCTILSKLIPSFYEALHIRVSKMG